ncbi:hypothetical protein OIS_03997 [Enterococcus faecium EnGen0035]|nr:hypothetical protein OIS_03997 [Enterococcus faecium EnGen0035]
MIFVTAPYLFCTAEMIARSIVLIEIGIIFSYWTASGVYNVRSHNTRFED